MSETFVTVMIVAWIGAIALHTALLVSTVLDAKRYGFNKSRRIITAVSGFFIFLGILWVIYNCVRLVGFGI